MTENSTAIVISVLLGLNAFFLIRFWYLVDEMRKDIKGFLQKDAMRTQSIETIEEDVKEIKRTIDNHGKKLTHLEIEMAKHTK